MNLDLWTEKRQYPRASLNWPVTLISNEGTTILGRVKDMSRGGVLVHVETILKIDEQVRLAIEIPEVNDVVSAIGKITRTRVLDEQNSSFTHGLSIRFTKISEEDCKYFSGNLAPEWRKTDTGDKQSARQKTPNKVDNTSNNRNKSPWWIIGVIAAVGLLLTTIVFFQSFIQKPPAETEEAVLRKEIQKLFEHTDGQIASMQQSQQQLAVSFTQIGKQVSGLKDSAISSGQIDEIRGLLEVLTRELNQIKIDIKKQAAQTKAAVTVPPKKTAEDKKILEYHTVRRGETIYQISKRYGLTVENLLRLNNLGRGVVIYSNQKLRIKPPSPIPTH